MEWFLVTMFVHFTEIPYPKINQYDPIIRHINQFHQPMNIHYSVVPPVG